MIIPGTKVDLIEDGDQIVSLVTRTSDFEPFSLKAWQEIVRAGSTAVDVGAYSGLYAIAAVQAGARAVAIEPLPSLYKRVVDNASRNQVEIKALQAAASDVDDIADFWRKGDFTSTSRLQEFPNSRKIQVKTVRLDSLELHDVSAIKIDVEGFESSVIRGARAILERDKPALIIEALDNSAVITEELKLLGYHLHKRLDGRNYLFKVTAPNPR